MTILLLLEYYITAFGTVLLLLGYSITVLGYTITVIGKQYYCYWDTTLLLLGYRLLFGENIIASGIQHYCQ